MGQRILTKWQRIGTDASRLLRQPNRWIVAAQLALVLIAAAGVAWFVLRPPYALDDLCGIFREKPDWFQSAIRTEANRGIPTAVLMAVIRQESSFRHNATPDWERWLGIIPWRPASTAYGYAQATDATWERYQRGSGRATASRDHFPDAIDFVGWYLNESVQRLGFDASDAYRHYLAYHEGHRGFREGRYRDKEWLESVARKVQRYADMYGKQLASCRRELARRNTTGSVAPTDQQPP